MNGTTTSDFLMLALDGLQVRFDALERQLEAIRNAAEELTGPKRRGKGRPRLAAKPQPLTGIALGITSEDEPRKGTEWTPAMRKAAAERAKARWARGEFDDRIKAPEKKRKLSAAQLRAMKANAAKARAARAAKKRTPAPAKKAPAAAKGSPWTPAKRRRLSQAMKESHRRRTAAAATATTAG
jgi:hypothetical protein